MTNYSILSGVDFFPYYLFLLIVQGGLAAIIEKPPPRLFIQEVFKLSTLLVIQSGQT